MSSEFAVYNGNEVKTIVGGVPLEGGRGPDEFCLIEKNEDEVTEQASADGSGSISVSNNNFWTVTLTVMATSKANLVLSGMQKSGLALDQGKLIFPVLVVDALSNGNVFASDKAYIKKWPSLSYQRENQPVQWVLGVYDPEVFIGGH
jgi:hypothetical protein